MHLSDDGVTILYPYPTIYQLQMLAWRRAERRFFVRFCAVAFLAGIVLSYPLIGG